VIVEEALVVLVMVFRGLLQYKHYSCTRILKKSSCLAHGNQLQLLSLTLVDQHI
jgi:hypothetical protein